MSLKQSLINHLSLNPDLNEGILSLIQLYSLVSW